MLLSVLFWILPKKKILIRDKYRVKILRVTYRSSIEKNKFTTAFFNPKNFCQNKMRFVFSNITLLTKENCGLLGPTSLSG